MSEFLANSIFNSPTRCKAGHLKDWFESLHTDDLQPPDPNVFDCTLHSVNDTGWERVAVDEKGRFRLSLYFSLNYCNVYERWLVWRTHAELKVEGWVSEVTKNFQLIQLFNTATGNYTEIACGFPLFHLSLQLKFDPTGFTCTLFSLFVQLTHKQRVAKNTLTKW